MNETTHLFEHCTNCGDGCVEVDGRRLYCPECHGTTRRLRSTHDPRSGLDFDEQPREATMPLAKWRHMVSLARALRWPDNSAALNELLDLIDPIPKENP